MARKNKPGAKAPAKQPPRADAPPRPLDGTVVEPPGQPGQGGSVAYFEASLTTYSGPLPPPAVLREFEQILPGSAERIFAQFEKQSEHRRTLESSAIANEITQSRRGTNCAFILGLVGLGVAAFFAYMGHPASGATVGGVGLASLLTAFLTGTVSRRKERTEKAKEMAKALSPPKPNGPASPPAKTK